LHTQHKGVDPEAFRRMFLQDVAQMARNLIVPRLFGPETRGVCNLQLAARRSVGHIRHDGAVAEWLKAAVC
jgi:hypothetical protein